MVCLDWVFSWFNDALSYKALQLVPHPPSFWSLYPSLFSVIKMSLILYQNNTDFH